MFSPTIAKPCYFDVEPISVSASAQVALRTALAVLAATNSVGMLCCVFLPEPRQLPLELSPHTESWFGRVIGKRTGYTLQMYKDGAVSLTHHTWCIPAPSIAQFKMKDIEYEAGVLEQGRKFRSCVVFELRQGVMPRSCYCHPVSV